jgi:alpha-glucosidase (family GH31 glycosyl hydrolase)
MAAAAFDTNLYASHPFFLSLDPSGGARGGYVRNSNGMDVWYGEAGDGSPGDELTFEINGGVLDLFVFTGPSPAEVAEQYHSVIGAPTLQPLWALGFHQCRYGYEKLQDMVDVVKGYADAAIPLDVAWLDIDYMSRWLDFTYDDELFPADDVKAFVDQLHHDNMKYVPIVDPGILAVDPSWDLDYKPYTEGVEMDIFVKDIQGNNYMGQVWPGPTHFPDWFHPNATEYWTNQLSAWHSLAEFDGIWIDMNEVSNFCSGQVCVNEQPDICPTGVLATQTECCLTCTDVEPDNKLDYPKFMINNDGGVADSPSPLDWKTIPASATHYGNLKQYDVHNLHGTMEGAATKKAMEDIRGGKRSFVLSRSSFPGHGNHAAHWTGDNAATWADLKASIVTVNNMALFGISMVGADICGFIGDSNEELCARWIETGAFHPFSRNHNTIGAAPQELFRWDSVAEAARSALGMRYKMLQYLYTQMWRANTLSETVSRYLWMTFPEDANTHTVDEQFMVGDAVLVTPVLEEGKRSVDGYFPAGSWYSLFTHDKIESQGEYKTLSAELEESNVHVRGGRILPMKTDGGLTTVDSANSGYSLLVALDGSGESTGDVYVDDNESVEVGENYLHATMSAKQGSFVMSSVHSGYAGTENNLSIDTIVVLGAADAGSATTATLTLADGKSTQVKVSADEKSLTVHLEDAGVTVSADFEISW